MKKAVIMLVALAAFSFTSCKNNKASKKMESSNTESASQEQSTSAKKYPAITFEDASYDFGALTAGEVVQHKFVFTNTGDAPLKVMKAKPSCGCTVPSWSKDPIAPGEKGHVMVKFNTRGEHGHQSKSVRLTTNTKSGNEIIRFTADVTPKAGTPTAKKGA